MRLATPEEIEHWDELVAKNPDGGNPLQSRAFAETKAKFGWGVRHVIHDSVAALYLVRQFPLAELWYCPKGPGVKDVEQLKDVLKELHPKKAFVVKLEPEIPNQDLSKLGLKKSGDVQVNSSTVVVDLSGSEEDLIASFKQKTRYNVRLAEKRGVKVSPVDPSPENLDKMYELMSATQERAGFYLRSKDYFKHFWWEHAKYGSGQLFFASFEGKVLAGAYVTFLGKNALYKDGGSTREHSELQAPYLLQWEVMRWLKQKGVENYDLHGTPPSDRLEDSSHKLHTLVRFKTGFNQEVTDLVGTWDLPLKPMLYRLWTLAGERVHSALWRRKHKDLYY